jgi:GDP-mannose transporter
MVALLVDMKKTASGPDYGPEYQRLLVKDLEAQSLSPQPSLNSPATSASNKPRLKNSTARLISGAVYLVSSSALTLLNKKVLVHYNFSAVHLLLLYHCLVGVLLVKISSWAGWAELEPLNREVVEIWLPVNLIFVAMLATNFYALQTVGVGMVSILKNLANLFIILGDYLFFSRTYTWHVWLCLALMTGSVITGGLTDINFSFSGYLWQIFNNVFTAAYALYLSHVTGRLQSHSPTHKKVNEMSMCYFNNLLSVPILLLITLANGELLSLFHQPALYIPSFQALATLGAVLGFCLSWSSIWFVSLTTATFYTLTGSCNKIVVAAAGIWMFGESKELRNLASIAVGLAAGCFLPFVKVRTKVRTSSSGTGEGPQQQQQQQKDNNNQQQQQQGALAKMLGGNLLASRQQQYQHHQQQQQQQQQQKQ